MEEQWISFIQDKWWIIALAIVAIVVIVRIVKTALKWAFILVIAAGLLLYGANYKEIVEDISGTVLSYAKEEAFEAMKSESGQASVSQDAAGNFIVSSPNFQVKGSVDSDEVEITFRGQSFKVSRNEIINTFIQQASEGQ
ncbi:hypothetical protein DUZ99_00645 [Xylanibacillus composti]|uniref:Uncharacterized protein n=1 Tax=Xylanibacillus composti TaxID=1572762 RepID=A0A8J4H3W1_9BACL|nr:hypothetical protein [Xylanibacillus composti]MDT9723525.1 hypothetical protein [Xylanibacillus composti]GIQ68439.1 hypothetical protein XYCOK13_12630 [Xylanibacillus composti]